MVESGRWHLVGWSRFLGHVLEESFLSWLIFCASCLQWHEQSLPHDHVITQFSLSLSSISLESRTRNENLWNFKSKEKFFLNYILHEVILHCDARVITTGLYKMWVGAPVCQHLSNLCSWNICNIIMIKFI